MIDKCSVLTQNFVLLMLCGVLALSCGCNGDAGTSAQDVEPIIKASGLLEGREVTIASEFKGTVAEVYVEEGDHVQAGDPLLRLDDALLQAQLAEAQNQVEAARASRDLVAAGPRAGELAAARAAVSAAQAAHDGTLEAWRNAIEARDNPQELNGRIIAKRAELEASTYQVELARLELQAAELERNQTEEGSPQRRAHDAQVRAAAANLAAAEATRDGAQAQLGQLYAILNNPLVAEAQVHAAADQYYVAAADLHLAQAQLAELQAQPDDARVAVAEATVGQARAAAAVLQAQQHLMTLAAPNDGLVSAKTVHAGEVVLAGVPLLTLAHLDPLYLTLYIPENRIGHVALGQSAQVRVEGFPGEVFRGQVVYISPRAEFTPRSVLTPEERVNTVFAIRVRLPNADGRLKPGMPADATLAY